MSKIFLYHVDKSKIDESQLSVLESILSATENKRFKKIKMIDARKNFILSRFLINKALMDFNCAQRFHIGRTIYGKPYLSPNPKNLKISISHTRDIICLLIAKNIEFIGVDIEEKNRKINKKGIIDFLYSPDEKLYLKPKDLYKNFFKYWTFKEAFTKALGKGLLIPFNQISFSKKYQKHYITSIAIEINSNITGFIVCLDKNEKSVNIDINKVIIGG